MTTPLYSATTISVEHVTITSANSFEAVRAKLEALVPRLDDGIFALLRFRQTNKSLEVLEASAPLSIFGFRDHGTLLQVANIDARAIQYDIGNPLTASKMTRHQLSAGLYAPIRVYLREDGGNGAAFEYDRPVSTFGQFGSEDVDKIARALDTELQSVLEAAAS